VQTLFGFDGGTVLLLLAWGAGISLFIGVSWIVLAEKVGAAIEAGFTRTWHAWQARRDRRVGQEALNEREEVVRKERKRMVKEAPVRIEAPPPAIEKSERSRKSARNACSTTCPTSSARHCACSTKRRRPPPRSTRPIWKPPRA